MRYRTIRNMNEPQKVITRFAPSPTGLLHIGTYRTAIFSYLYAKKNGGTFVLRIEDTDRERSKKEYEENILESLTWLGLTHDKFYRQSEHVSTHQSYLEKMIAEGTAYLSKEEAKDGSGTMKELVRFRNPNIDITFKDEVKGDVTMNTTDLGDFVLAKNLQEPLFHFAVVVDDFLAGVTHVIRGEDHTSNTPRQILIQRALGAPTPIYAHLPLVLGPDKLKLSKRRGAQALTSYRDKGFLPQAILNGVAFIGWNPGTEQEIFSHDELIASFELSKVQKSTAVFNEEKLKWFNKEHIKLLPEADCSEMIFEWLPDEIKNLPSFTKEAFQKIVPIIKDRILTLGDVAEMARAGELRYFFQSSDTYPAIDLLWKSLKDTENGIEKTKIHLQKILSLIHDQSNNLSSDEVRNLLWPYAEESGRGEVLWPLRYALSGREKSPDPFMLMEILGITESKKRIQTAIDALK